MKLVVALALLSGAGAYVAPIAPSRTATRVNGAGSDYAKTLYGAGRGPVGFWDPLNYADIGSEATVDFFRAAEVKHGRVAMMGCLGYFHHLAGITLPGYLSPTEGVSFADLSALTPAEAWLKVPTAGVQQIFGNAGAFELGCCKYGCVG